MKRLMFAAFIAFWSSVATVWSFATLAAGSTPPTPPDATDRSITTEELARHATAEDCWMAIDGVVYDFTEYLPQHPAPPVVMNSWCGKESSEAYHTKGYGRPHSPAADALLPGYRVGTLE